MSTLLEKKKRYKHFFSVDKDVCLAKKKGDNFSESNLIVKGGVQNIFGDKKIIGEAQGIFIRGTFLFNNIEE